MSLPSLLVPVKKRRRAAGAFRFPKSVLLASSHSSDRLPLKQLAADLADLGVRARVRIGQRRPDDADVYCLRTKKVMPMMQSRSRINLPRRPRRFSVLTDKSSRAPRICSMTLRLCSKSPLSFRSAAVRALGSFFPYSATNCLR